MTAPKPMTREDWLNRAVELLRPICAARGFAIPDKVRVSCGFPRGRRTVIGQCWSHSNSADGAFEIFISPTQADSLEVLQILVHELGHAAVGLEHGHKRPFARFCQGHGLLPPWKATTAGPAFKVGVADVVLAAIGVPYPHAKLREGDKHTGPKKQTTRLMKCDCPSCGYTIRTTMKWILTSGAPLCPSEGCDRQPMDFHE